MTYATPAPAQDSVRGSGTIAWGNSFVFDAQAAPDGSTPGGAVSFTDPSRGRTVQGGVVCLRVRGGRATIVYEDVATPAGLPGAGGTVRVLDSPEGDRQATAV